jgi:hypothetical protein
VGCNTAYPTNYLSSSGPSAATVIDFESGTGVNANLAEANRPGNQVILPGAVMVINPSAGYGSGAGALVSPGANGTNFCYHVSGSVTDTGNSSYPSLQLQIPLEKSSSVTAYYDGELFTGVKFYLKVMGTDNAGKRSFSIPVAQTEPPASGGDCVPSNPSNACYNDFAITFPATGGAWQPVSTLFSSFTRGAYGAAVTPTTLSGLNLQQILYLAWSESNNNNPGTVIVDYYVDEIQFY